MELFSKRRKIDAHVDLVPMIDTVLQLFMIFLLSASFVSASVNLNLPRASTKQTSKASVKEIVVSIDAGNKIYLNKRPILLDQLEADLQSLMQQSKDPMVMVLADRNLLYEQVLDVIAQIQDSGATNVLLAYDPNKKTRAKR
jgi:biopolymer transport protein ExbD